MLLRQLALRVLAAGATLGTPAAALGAEPIDGCASHEQGDASPSLPPPRERLHPQELRGRALWRTCSALERTRLQLRVDVATPAWLLLADPDNSSSEALVVRAQRLIASVTLARVGGAAGRPASAVLDGELHVHAAALELAQLRGWLVLAAARPLLAPFDVRVCFSARPVRTGALEAKCCIGQLRCESDPFLLAAVSRSLLSLKRAAQKQRAVLESWIEVASPGAACSGDLVPPRVLLPLAVLGAIQRLRLALQVESATLRLLSDSYRSEDDAAGDAAGTLGTGETPLRVWQRLNHGGSAVAAPAAVPDARQPSLLLPEVAQAQLGSNGIELHIGTLTFSVTGAERVLAERIASAKPSVRTPEMGRCPLLLELEGVHCTLHELCGTGNSKHAPLLELKPKIHYSDTHLAETSSVLLKESKDAAGCFNAWLLGLSSEGLISPELLLPHILFGRLHCALPLHRVSPLLRRMDAEWKLPAREALHAWTSVLISLASPQNGFSVQQVAPPTAAERTTGAEAAGFSASALPPVPASPLPPTATALPLSPPCQARSTAAKPVAAAAAAVVSDGQRSVDDAFEILDTLAPESLLKSVQSPSIIKQATRPPPAFQVRIHAFKLCLNDAGLHALSPLAAAKEASASTASSAALDLYLERACFQLEGRGAGATPLVSVASLQLHAAAQLESPLPHPFGLAAARRYERLLLGLGHPHLKEHLRQEGALYRANGESSDCGALRLRFARIGSEVGTCCDGAGARSGEGFGRIIQVWVAPLLVRSPGACTYALLELGSHAEGVFRLLNKLGGFLSLANDGESGIDASVGEPTRAPVLSLRLALQPCWLQPLREGGSKHRGLLHGEHEPFGSAELHMSGAFGEIRLYLAAPGEEVTPTLSPSPSPTPLPATSPASSILS